MLKHMLASGGGGLPRGADPPLGPPPPPPLAVRMATHSPPLTLPLGALDTSKHSLGGTSSSLSPSATNATKTTGLDHSQPSVHDTPTFLSPAVTQTTMAPTATIPRSNGDVPRMANGGLHLSRRNNSSNNATSSSVSRLFLLPKKAGVGQMLSSLGLLCLLSLLLALLALVFLLKISPGLLDNIREILSSEQVRVITAEEYVVVYEVTLGLCALTLSLNLCCLLVCAIQFLFAVKLARTSGGERTTKFLQKASVTRICAVGGFFISIPVFLTGVILYTLIQFHSTPAIITSVFIGCGVIFCGCALVHNVFVWQKERNRLNSHGSTMLPATAAAEPPEEPPQTLPVANLDLSSVSHAHELSTLV